LAFTSLTVLVMVVLACVSAAHMCGVPELKSCSMIVTTTRAPLAWAAATRLVSAAEFHVVASESAAKVPSSFTCRPK
jgi:hypothetical protein